MNVHRTNLSSKLDDAIWAYRMIFKSPIGISPSKLVFGKACHLPVDLEQKALWALKNINWNCDVASRGRIHQLLDLDEFHLKAYESSALYKLKLILGKLKSKGTGPHNVTRVYGNGAIEIKGAKGVRFKVNRQRLKAYFGESQDIRVVKVVYLDDV
ncbi:uncharacterized protein [Solanum tuberosum]|uniref:uncharacterized protein n=1 Tax=Solanum tuberosum TaxID=4113 RepID=UPI00073A11E0|nr:PREDICTED: uncharacterized protein LOC107059664 [Solanum tuberosum]